MFADVVDGRGSGGRRGGDIVTDLRGCGGRTGVILLRLGRDTGGGILMEPNDNFRFCDADDLRWEFLVIFGRMILGGGRFGIVVVGVL